ncbi:MAG: ATP-dependent DNA ligase [Thermodesulfobacteria bacterium]|nr:hypothetical protein [Thermodesulfobacteriota bacterium]MCU4138201.1 ATP-dependent DNA ligase [Thermodesulfobacteriota bacterium]
MKEKIKLLPIFLMQPIPYFGEKLNGEWIVEPKIDGWRLQIIKYEDGRIEYWGRRLEKHPNWTKNLSYLNPSLKDIPNGTLLDCELYSTKGRRGIPSVLTRTKKAEPLIFVFDIIFLNNEFLGNKPLRERKRILELLKLNPPIYLIEYKKLENLEESLKENLEKGYEGIVLKNLDSPYIISKEAPIATHYWRKMKG